MERSVPLGVRKGAWTEEEDELLRKCIEQHGVGKWNQVPSRAGLNRCRKSCRLRWLNYLSPNIKRGNFTPDEIDLIIRLHKLLGNRNLEGQRHLSLYEGTLSRDLFIDDIIVNFKGRSTLEIPKFLARWSLIAGRLCGRTSNDIKNYWNTHHHKKDACQKDESNKLKTEEITKTKIYKPQPRTFKAPVFISTVKNSNFDNLVQMGDTSSGPSSESSQVNHKNYWWDNLSINDLENAFELSLDNLNEETMKNNWVSDEIGTSRSEIGDISLEEGHEVSDWMDIFTKNVDIRGPFQ